jgi:hypothetical protein
MGVPAIRLVAITTPKNATRSSFQSPLRRLRMNCEGVSERTDYLGQGKFSAAIAAADKPRTVVGQSLRAWRAL